MALLRSSRLFSVRPAMRGMRDYLALTKPRITLMVAVTAAGGMWLAPTRPSSLEALIALAALTLVVSSANAFNCWLERDVDRFMTRTADRPLPARRLEARGAFWFACIVGLIAVPALTWGVNPLTGLLGGLSLVLYVAVYTPLKRATPLALYAGAVPGAMPPLMGWTAATAELSPPGLALFGLLFLWQLPHFIAIATFRAEEYRRADLKVLPSAWGPDRARRHAVAYVVLLVLVSLALVPLRVAGWAYGAVALGAGLYFLAAVVRGLRPSEGDAGARRAFVASLIYLVVVFAALLLDAS